MSSDLEAQAIISEFEKLKDEQIVRIQYRENLYYLTLIVAGGLLGAAYGEFGIRRALIVLPIVLFVILSVYTNNDQKITAIGDYFKLRLNVRLRSALGSSESYFDWEQFHKEKKGRFWRKLRHLVTKLILFVGAPTAAVTFFVDESVGRMEFIDCVFLTVAAICIAWNIVVVIANADLV